MARFIIETEYSVKNKYIANLINSLFNIRVVNELVAMKLSEIIVKKAEHKKLIKKTDDFPTLSESYEIMIEFIT